MEVSCNQEYLNRALNIVSRAASNKNGTKYVVLEADEANLRLKTGDADLSLRTSIACLVNKGGTIALPADLLSQVTKCLTDTRIDIVQEAENNQTRITADRNVCHFYTNDEPVKDSNHPTLQDEISLKIDAKAFHTAIRRTYIAIAKEGDRPILNTANLKTEGASLTLATADGFRLSVQKIELEEAPAEDLNVNIPAKALAEMARLLPSATRPVTLAFGHYQQNPATSEPAGKTARGLFTVESPSETVQMHFSTINGTFPSYQGLIPENPETVISINRELFHDSVTRATVFSKEASNIIKLVITEPEAGQPDDYRKYLSVMAEAHEIGSITEPVEISNLTHSAAENANDRIAFNYRYLADVLQAVTAGDEQKSDIHLELKNTQSPGVIRLPEDPNFVHVLMPMFIQW